MKKILSFLLGLTLLMSLTVPALAATSDTIDKESLRVGYGVWPDDIQKTTSVGSEIISYMLQPYPALLTLKIISRRCE